MLIDRIEFPCPTCRRTIHTGLAMVGWFVSCSHCGERAQVPTPMGPRRDDTPTESCLNWLHGDPGRSAPD